MSDTSYDIGSEALLKLLADGMTSSSPNVNLSVLTSLLTGDAAGLPLSALLGTASIGSLGQAVADAGYGSQVSAEALQAMDFQGTESQFAADPEIAAGLAAVKAGVPPETYVMQQKAEIAAMEGVSDEQRSAENFRIDALKPVLDIYRDQLAAYSAFQGRVAAGEVVDRDGVFYEVASGADRRAALEEQGITGALANPAMYESDRSRQLAAAEKFLADATKQESTQKKANWDQQVAGTRLTPTQIAQITALKKKAADGAVTTLPEDAGWWDRIKGYFNGQTQQNPTATGTTTAGAAGGPMVVPPRRNGPSAEEIAARAGMYYSNKNAYAAQQAAKSSGSELDALRLENQRRYSQMLKDAESASTRTGAEDYITTQSALLAALASGGGSSGGGGGTAAAKPKIRLDQGTIQQIVGAVTR